MERETEQYLLSRIKAGDQSALKQVFETHYRWLVAEVYQLIRDRDGAQDLVQDVFATFWQKRAVLEIHTSIAAYLKKAAINTALNYIKTRKRFDFNEPETFLTALPDTTTTAEDLTESHTKQLMAHIDNLPEKCRIVFMLSRFDDLSHKEIAEKLGISTKTIENQITKALKMLKAAFVASADDFDHP